MDDMTGQDDRFDWGYRRADRIMPGVAASAVGYAARSVGTSLHRGLPSPHLTLVVTFDEPVVTAWSADRACGPEATRVDVVVAGLHLTPAYISQPPSQSGIELALHPSAARSVFGLPASELCCATYEGSDVIGPQISRLRERLIDSGDWSERFVLVRRFLQDRVDRADRSSGVRPEVAAAWSWLVRHHGTGRIDAVADHVALSPRRLHQLFTAEFGLGPKRFNRLLRFQRAKTLMADSVDHGRPVDLAGVAARCGYADQSHLTREFGSLVQVSPARWLAEEYGATVSAAQQPTGSAEMFYRRATHEAILKP